jgi:hypothetical protein
MDITELISLVTAAQKDLRSTTQNWGEDCLFACDDKLTGALQGLETLRAELQAGRARVAELEAEKSLVRLVTTQYAPDTCDRQGCDAPATEYRLLRAGAVHLCAEHAAEAARR